MAFYNLKSERKYQTAIRGMEVQKVETKCYNVCNDPIAKYGFQLICRLHRLCDLSAAASFKIY